MKNPLFQGRTAGVQVVCMAVLLLLSRCNKEEPIPSYIHIDQINLATNVSIQGSASHKILDAWIYVDDQFVGAFEMPCTVPALYQGTHTLKIFAGIKENGISSTRIPYPFYYLYEQTVTLTPGEILNVNPSVTYGLNAGFSWLEDFDGSEPSLCDSAVTTDTVMHNSAPSVFEGLGSGEVVLTGAVNSPYQEISCNKYTLPKDGSPIFLEMNYNCNTRFNVGIIGYSVNNLIDFQQISLTLNPTDGAWNKVYVNLTNEVMSATGSAKFGVFFSMLKGASVTTSYFYVDNVKLIN